MFLFKKTLRRLIPKAAQVPLKYYYGQATGKLEPEIRLLRYVVDAQARAIDVGGNRGAYAYALQGKARQLDVFEPNSVCSDILKDWSRTKGNVRVHECALSDHAGSASLHVPTEGSMEHDASASLDNVFTSATTKTVQTRRLDDFAFGDVSFVKIDVEGHEHKVLLGGQGTIQQQKPTLLIEIEQRHSVLPIAQTFALLSDWGYTGWFLENGTLKPLQAFDVDRHQSDVLHGRHDGPYINNFIFLARDRVAAGAFQSLFASFAA